MPADVKLEKRSKTFDAGDAERTTVIQEYEDATKGRDDGFYTCVVFHGSGHDPVYSSDQCEVIIVDICLELANCTEDQTCVPDYETGTFECTCDYECPFIWDFLCSDTCEMFVHECAMNEQVCKDGIEREVANKGQCPNRVEPRIENIDKDIEKNLGELITLSSGLLEDGTPMATVHWVFYPEEGTPTYLSARENYQFTTTEDSVGIYRITLMQCMNQTSAVHNEYRFTILTVTDPPVITSTPTPTPEDPGPLTAIGYTCSAFPGGVIDDFNSRAHFYDLSCTHVLAADIMPGGSFLNPWFIYGTFDNHDGSTALMSMTFYLGRDIFEVQRGWLVHTGDEKLALVEGVPRVMGESGCDLTFKEFHIWVICEHFEAYYDGLMSGHIKLKTDPGNVQSLLQKSGGNIGLCFDNNSGWRPNWQVGNMRGNCEIDQRAPPCFTALPDSCQLSQPHILDLEFTACGVGAEAACNELHCNGATPTPAQKCALEQANKANCDLKRAVPVSGDDITCLKDPCEWMTDVVSRGCPQENLPFVCP